MTRSERPLDGIRVLELGQLLAGPFAGSMLGWFGAEVVKVEPPGTGDPIRTWRHLDADGTSLWWRSLARNKKCVTLDLRTDEGRALCRRLAMASDVLIENFRPGRMEEWGLGPETFQNEHPSLVYARVSGYGQTGPYAERPGYAAVCEAVGGLRHLIGRPGEAPVRPNLSLGDTLAGLHAVIGVLLALVRRERDGSSAGQVVDISLVESVFDVLESVVPEHDRLGVVRQPAGTAITGVVPSNTYRCADGAWVVIGANGDSVFRRAMRTMGRDDLADDPGLADNPGRVARAEDLDAAIGEWCVARTRNDVVRILGEASVPAGPINDAADLARDPHLRARGLFERVDVEGEPLAIPAFAPRLVDTPGRTDWPGPALGAHNREVYGGLLRLSDDELARLAEAGVI